MAVSAGAVINTHKPRLAITLVNTVSLGTPK